MWNSACQQKISTRSDYCDIQGKPSQSTPYESTVATRAFQVVDSLWEEHSAADLSENEITGRPASYLA
ncbi:hypothetical protein AKJ16_DCAP01332 [Drosera capensis]